MQLGIPYRIEDIVAHAERMSLLHELVSYTPEQIVVAVNIGDDTEFCEPGVGVPGWVGIEYMAQAVGAFSGIDDVQHGRKPQIGLLLGSRRYESTVSAFPIGARLLVTARLELQDESNLVVFTCTIEMGGECVARADIKAIRPDDVHALVKAQS